MSLKPRLSHLYLHYWTPWMQQATWAKAEIYKPMGLWNEFSQLLLLLPIYFNYRPGVIGVVVVYVVCFVLLVRAGGYYAQTGAQKVITSMGNEHNPELQKIQESLDRIIKHLGI